MLTSVATNSQITSVLTADIWTLSTIYFTITLWGNSSHYSRIRHYSNKKPIIQLVELSICRNSNRFRLGIGKPIEGK